MDTSNIVCFNGINTNSYTEKNMIIVYDCESNTHLAELKFKLNVYNFKIKSDYLIVVLDFKIKIFSIFLNMELIESVLYNCSYYSLNIFDINSSFKKDLFAISNDNNKGRFFIHRIKLNYNNENEIKDIEPTNIIKAHKDKIIFIKINFTGDYVATISKKGTNLKIFNTKTYELIFKFKRGLDSAENISISFDIFTNYIGLFSNKGTVHIWNLTESFESNNIVKLLKLDYHRDNINYKYKSNQKAILSFDKFKNLSLWNFNGTFTTFLLNDKKKECKIKKEDIKFH